MFLRDIDLADARSLVDRFASAGATTVTFVLVGERGPHAVRRLADAVLRGPPIAGDGGGGGSAAGPSSSAG